MTKQSRIKKQNGKDKKGKKKIKKRKLLFLALLIFIVVLALSAIIFPFRIKEIKVIEMKLEVTESTVGVGVIDNETINFGVVVRGIAGAVISKSIKLNSDEKCYGFIFFKGKLAKWITVSDRIFVVDGKKDIGLNANVPPDAIFDIYTGEVVIVLFR